MSERLGTISRLTVRPKQQAGGLAGGGGAALRAVNLLIVFRIQLSLGLMSREGTRTAHWMSAGVMTRVRTS